jgi:hypothetical protein
VCAFKFPDVESDWIEALPPVLFVWPYTMVEKQAEPTHSASAEQAHFRANLGDIPRSCEPSITNRGKARFES